MEAVDDAVQHLRLQIATVETQLSDLKRQLAKVEAAAALKSQPLLQNGKTHDNTMHLKNSGKEIEGSHDYHLLKPEEYKRYGRQLIMPEIGIHGQLALRNASVLIVGLGGLGCPAAAYLAGAGVGRVGLVDGDTVELSNLHRQILHDENGLGREKVESAAERLRALNSNIEVTIHKYHLTTSTAVSTMENYDIVLDCTDRPATRYLISDAAILAGKPVVTASALRTEGQMMVLNDTRVRETEKRLCYRCVFPKPPPAESVLTCGEGGIIGPVVGVMGVLMAMEIMKILLHRKTDITQAADSLLACVDGRLEKGANGCVTEPSSLLLYSAFSHPQFRSVRLRGQRKGCISCSDKSTITREMLESGSLNYDEFCGVTHPMNILSDVDRISPQEYHQLRETEKNPHILVDVRERVQFDICHLPTSLNIPYWDFSNDPIGSISSLRKIVDSDPKLAGVDSLYLICRFGNDSQLAVRALKELKNKRDDVRFGSVADIRGGLRAWRQQVDPAFPEY